MHGETAKFTTMQFGVPCVEQMHNNPLQYTGVCEHRCFWQIGRQEKKNKTNNQYKL